MSAKTITGLLIAAFLFTLFTNCEPDGLMPVSGVEGTLLFKNSWPDSARGSAIIVFDQYLLNDVEHPVDHLISFSSPATKTDSSFNYFIELKEGAYYMVVIGLLLEPSYFIIKLDSLSAAEELPVFYPQNDLIGNMRPLLIDERSITDYPDWEVYF